mmetsp:Transcript_29654/g.39580  ORF Transcript_29654/g.39580 Transcript_29654/m.39580 type:complete len:212 (-) Transcript_29654:216-851(-)
MFRLKFILVPGAHFHKIAHVTLLESGKHCSCVLSVLETSCNTLPHARHLGTPLGPLSKWCSCFCNRRWGGLGRRCGRFRSSGRRRRWCCSSRGGGSCSRSCGSNRLFFSRRGRFCWSWGSRSSLRSRSIRINTVETRTNLADVINLSHYLNDCTSLRGTDVYRNFISFKNYNNVINIDIVPRSYRKVYDYSFCNTISHCRDLHRFDWHAGG